MFPTRVRYTGASMGYQLAGILGGALAPIISVALLDRFDTSLVVSVYVVLMLALTTVCVLLAPETSRLDLQADPVEQRAPRRRGMTTVSIDLNSDLGEGVRRLDPRRRRRAAGGGHQRQRRLRFPRRRPRHPAPRLRAGGRARRRHRRPGRLPGPARLRPPGHGRRPADADQRGHLPDRRRWTASPASPAHGSATSSRTGRSTTPSCTTWTRPPPWSRPSACMTRRCR